MPALPCIRISTDSFPAERRFAVWRQAMTPLFDVSPPARPEIFTGSAYTYLIGTVAFGGTRVDALAYERTPARIAADGIDHILIRLDFTSESPQGALRVIDLGQPIRLPLAPMDCLCLFVPRDVMEIAAPGIERLHDRFIAAPRSEVLAGLMRGLAQSAPTLDRTEAGAVVDALLAAFGISLWIQLAAEDRPDARDTTLLRRAQKHIDAHLSSRDLTPERIAQALGMSRTSLYRLFRDMGGVADYVRRRRLRRVQSILTLPGETRRISEIAFEYGFNDEATFSRAFRRAFGYTATAARETGARLTDPALVGDDAHLHLSPPDRPLMWADWMNKLGG
ncbi:helix-turn-helix domain-containing protein [Brevundimonas sp.]|uniref:helix-turn-helix domain-containing protein n=1 Tax=Brevundimonas sp. TaxID=1871086 RepID=UPI002612C3DA|nr:helix-turn-helix domain-containing protein [Brevundimonas sp.]